jgi:hypothetical protein
MLANILRNTEWSQLSSFVSPAFFAVLPPRKLYRRSRSLLLAGDDPACHRALAARQASLAALPLSIMLSQRAPPRDAQPAVDDGLGEAANAERIVTLYFHQLFSDGDSLLDLRRAALHDRPRGLCWTPAPWVARWDASFLSALRDVYSGFYTDAPRVFRAGLSALGIAGCEDLFRAHFGSDQRAHVFRTKEFVSTFHKVFVRCREQGVELHPDFLPLGIYLACLHDALEPRAVKVDVRAAFDRATRARADQPQGRTHAQ